MMEFIEKRSDFTRWFLVPIVFIGSSSLIHASVIILSWVLSIVWGEDARANLWIFKFIIANGVSAFCAAYFSGQTAPRFKVLTTCVAASILILLMLLVSFGMFTVAGNWWGANEITIVLSTISGAVIAIWMAIKS